MYHDTTIKHRRDWAAGEDHWYVECYTCDWVSPLQRTVALAQEREEEHHDEPEYDYRPGDEPTP